LWHITSPDQIDPANSARSRARVSVVYPGAGKLA